MTGFLNDINNVIEYIENHLDEKLDLERIAEGVHYSKYHLHRIFSNTIGMTIHEYVTRRQLTEAAKLLVFSDKSIIEIAFVCGYESQQAFSSVFKSFYKISPSQFRDHGVFYPLQLKFTINHTIANKKFKEEDILIAKLDDIPEWMNLMRLVIDGYPVMNEQDYLKEITKSIEEQRALVLKDGQNIIGAMTFSKEFGSIEFFGIHPLYRKHKLHQLFLNTLVNTYLPNKEISMTTYREGDKADLGHRDLLKQLGFAERELLIEYGYPTQRFVLSKDVKKKENTNK